MRHALRCAFAVVAGMWAFAGTTAAQRADSRVVLEVRPRPGDTLRIALEQSFTVSGGPKGAPDSAITYSTSYHVLTRDVVERADARGTVILAIIDSVRTSTTASFGASQFPGINRRMEGMRVRLRVAPDGASQVIEGLKQLDPDLQSLLGEVPSVLPAGPVSPGESWTRELPMPAAAEQSFASASSMLHATFRFDSLTENGNTAWISLQGRVDAIGAAAAKPADAEARQTGTLTGVLRLDRRRGWLAEFHATAVIESSVTAPGTTNPILVKVRVEQVMRTAPTRR